MSIHKAPPKPTTNAAALAAFIEGAPDATKGAAPKAPKVQKKPDAKPYENLRGKQIQTTITMQPDELDTINQAAKAANMSRALFIRRAALKAAQKELKSN